MAKTKTEKTASHLPARSAIGSGTLPPADQGEARRRELEVAAQDKTISEIMIGAEGYCEFGRENVQRMIDWTNAGRRVGLLIIGFLDQLPGKRMTRDFWRQYQSKFRSPGGLQLTLEQFNWFERLARNNPEPIKDLAGAMAARQMAFEAAGFELIGERAPGIAHEHVPYNDFMGLFTGYRPLLKKVVEDPAFGPIEDWPEERKQRAWLEMEPFYREVILKLKPDLAVGHHG